MKPEEVGSDFTVSVAVFVCCHNLHSLFVSYVTFVVMAGPSPHHYGVDALFKNPSY